MLPVRSKSLFELASVPPVHSESLFEPAVQDHYSKVLVSVALCSESLYSALLCYVHGYARVHTSIYIYIYVAVDPLNRAFGFVASPELVGGLSARGLDLILTSMLVKHL